MSKLTIQIGPAQPRGDRIGMMLVGIAPFGGKGTFPQGGVDLNAVELSSLPV